MKSFTCRDAGMDCDWRAEGQSDDEILNQVKTHADSKHGIKNMAQDMIDKVKSKISEIKAA